MCQMCMKHPVISDQNHPHTFDNTGENGVQQKTSQSLTLRPNVKAIAEEKNNDLGNTKTYQPKKLEQGVS